MANLKHSRIWFYFIIILMSFTLCSVAEAKSVFPGAKGFGIETRAAYGGFGNPTIYIVNTLADNYSTPTEVTRNGITCYAGSLKACISDTTHTGTGVGRIILFEVSGTIIGTQSNYVYNIKIPYTSILGQTAPSPGITLRNIHMNVRSHDILIQHIRSRVGDKQPGPDPNDSSALEIISNTQDVYNVVIDHCSFSWAVDNNFGIGAIKYSLHDVTVSNCIISEPLRYSIHPKGGHDKNFQISNYGSERTLLLNSLIASGGDRNPEMQRKSAAIVNNVTYNTGYGVRFSDDSKKPIYASMVGNYQKRGPESTDSRRYNAVSTFEHSGKVAPGSQIYLSNNRCAKGTQPVCGPGNNWCEDWIWDPLDEYNLANLLVTSAPVWPTNLTAMDVDDVETYVLAHAGARPADRDSVDQRIVDDVRNSTGAFIDSQDDVGGWPALPQNTRLLNLPHNPHGDDDSDGYTNLEEWLHELAAQVEGSGATSPPAPPIGLKIVN